MHDQFLFSISIHVFWYNDFRLPSLQVPSKRSTGAVVLHSVSYISFSYILAISPGKQCMYGTVQNNMYYLLRQFIFTKSNVITISAYKHVLYQVTQTRV